ncbi:MAG: prepilin peptidase [Clostridiales bacterium]|nr:prepilin peptidase [Clostridiales bacterium]
MQLFMDGLILAVMSAAVWMDFDSYRISNFLLLPAAVVGIGLNTYESGLWGAKDSLAGCFLPFALLLPLYGLSMLGAGDIKLLMAAGAFTGFKGSIFSLITAFFIGAVISLTLMIKHRNFLPRLKNFFHYICQVKSKHFLGPYYDLKSPEKGETVHFSLCIALGVCIYFLIGRTPVN